jgi:tetratricopeptide (TPR) repeat protein
VEEEGNLSAFRRSKKYVEKAVQELQTHSNLSDSTRHSLSKRINALRGDLDEQIRVASNTFYGSFPLVRLLVPSLFITSGSASDFHLIEDPSVMAVRHLARTTQEDAMPSWMTVPNMHVIFWGKHVSPHLESEFLRTFNESARFFVHPKEEVAQVLSSKTLKSFEKKGPSPAAVQKLREAYHTSHLAVLNLKKHTSVGDVSFFKSRVDVYGQGENTPSSSITRHTTARDRRSQALPLFFCNLLLLGGAISVYLWLVRSRGEEISWMQVVYPTGAFLFSRFLFGAFLPLLEQLAQNPRSPLLASFWWPLLIGFVLFTGIPVVLWLAAHRYGLNPSGYGGPLLTASALGVVAYAATPLFLWTESLAWGLVLALAITAALLGYIAGSALDTPHPHLRHRIPRSALILPALSSFIVGGTLLYAHWPFFLTTCTATTVACGAVLSQTRQKTDSSSHDEPTEKTTQAEDGKVIPPSTKEELLERLNNPPYIRLSSFKEANNRLLSNDSNARFLALTGPSGVGKTATAEELLTVRRSDSAVLKGSCSKSFGEPTTYEPFREALESHFGLEAFTRSNVEAQHEQVAEMLDGLFESFVPFISIISPPIDEEESGAGSPAEIYRAVELALQQMATRQPVILFIDDLQWADPESLNLLEHLLEEFLLDGSPSTDYPITILVTARTDPGQLPDVYDELSSVRDTITSPECTLSLSAPQREEKLQILTSGLGLNRDSAEYIINQVDAESFLHHGHLFWLFEVVRHLVQEGAIRSPHTLPSGEPSENDSERRFYLDNQFHNGSLPVPDRLHDVIEEEVDERPQHRTPLAYAACLGQSFHASTLVEILGESRFDVLSLLREIEEETGWLRDIQEKDDVYRFSSSYLLEGIREHFEIQDVGPTDAAPQLIREYHAQAARALETVEDQIGESQKENIANHYYAAGLSHAERAYHACLNAARSTRSIYSFPQSHAYLNKAQDCAKITGNDEKLLRERLRLTCFEAHITGTKEKLETAFERGQQYLQRNEDPPSTIVKAVAQVAYDLGTKTKEREYFNEAVRWGRHLVEHGDSQRIHAEGHHFIGVALPRKPQYREERRKHLEEAYQLLKNIPGEDQEALRLQGHVMNSLAELLVEDEPSEEERIRARDLYERRIEINERHKLGDLQGLAMSHGGLGRLFLYNESDPEAAREHFEEDLQLAEELGDVGGQVQMHSHLGECALALGNLEEAHRQYEQSLNKADSWVSECFALAGLIITCAYIQDPDGLNKYGRRLESTIKWDKLFSGLADRVEETLEEADSVANGLDWFRQIRERIQSWR